jgi:hypothetical protein
MIEIIGGAVVVVIIAIYWCYQFAFLMSLEDGIFAGRFDKPCWCAAFLLLPPIAPFAFALWRYTRAPKA